jgi:hypothetical protein
VKVFFVLILGLVALTGCSKPTEPAAPAEAPTSANAAPIQAAPGAPADANKPLTDGRMDKSAEAGAAGAGGK